MRTIVLATIFAVLAGICGRSACAQTVDQVAPQVKATGYVTDLAGVLSQSGREQLTALCTEVSQKTQAEIAVVTIRSLDDQPIEDYSHTLAERLGLGPKGQGRGVLILFSTSDHKDRIEVGYTLEPILPDGKVGDFLRELFPICAPTITTLLFTWSRGESRTSSQLTRALRSPVPLSRRKSHSAAEEIRRSGNSLPSCSRSSLCFSCSVFWAAEAARGADEEAVGGFGL